MLTSLTLEDWKSFGSGENVRNELRLAPLTFLVGPNASGKSNVLDALRFLQGAALGYPLADVLGGHYEGQREVWQGIRGGAVEAARSRTSEFTIATRWSWLSRDTRDIQPPIDHRVQVRVGDRVEVASERLGDADDPFFDTANGRPSRRDVLPAVSGAVDAKNSDEAHSSLRLLLRQHQATEARPVVEFIVRRVLEQMTGAVFLDVQPSYMRVYRPKSANSLGASAENISPFLDALSREPGRIEDITSWLAELCAPEIERIDFDRTNLGEVMLMLVEKSERTISARSASDGTLRFLGEVTALLTCPPGTLVVIEEPDLGLHPSRLGLLVELLEYVTSKRGVQVLATTHSPTLLAHLSRESLGDVVAFGRDPDAGWTVCSRLQDLAHFETLRGSKDVEHLVSTGWLELAL